MPKVSHYLLLPKDESRRYTQQKVLARMEPQALGRESLSDEGAVAMFIVQRPPLSWYCVHRTRSLQDREGVTIGPHGCSVLVVISV